MNDYVVNYQGNVMVVSPSGRVTINCGELRVGISDLVKLVNLYEEFTHTDNYFTNEQLTTLSAAYFPANTPLSINAAAGTLKEKISGVEWFLSVGVKERGKGYYNDSLVIYVKEVTKERLALIKKQFPKWEGYPVEVIPGE